MSHQEIAETFNITCTFLDIFKPRSAISAAWKRLVVGTKRYDQTNKPRIKSSDKTIDVAEASTNRVYRSLVLSKCPTISSQRKWQETFPNLHAGEDPQTFWTKIYKAPFQTIRDTKMQTFQFKLIHRTLPCNKYLHNIRIKETDTCSYCHDQDTIQHFFWSCPLSRTFWQNIISWLSNNVDIHARIDMEDFLFGLPHTHPHAKTLHHDLSQILYLQPKAVPLRSVRTNPVS